MNSKSELYLRAARRNGRDGVRPVLKWLSSQGLVCVREVCSVSYNPVDIVACRYAERVGRRAPELLETVAVELKLHNVTNVLSQAVRNRGSFHRSYAALPSDKCKKLRPQTVVAFESEGVGLLAVSPSGVYEILSAEDSGVTDKRLVKNLWRRVRGAQQTITTQPTASPEGCAFL